MGRASNPYDFFPPVASFQVTSNDITDGEMLPIRHVSGILGAGCEDVSPHLIWFGAPGDTKSYTVTCFDPDAPTGSGFWHWIVYDIPATVMELATGVGSQDGAELPQGAKQLKNDAGLYGYLGSAPPPGHGPHRYMFVVHALNIDMLPINEEVSAAICGFNMFGTTIGRALVTPIYKQV